MALFSIIIPTYNRRERLQRALRSVLAQRCADYELIVVDDGSTDGTPEAVAALAPKARLFRQDNRGASAARNTGLHHATGAYVAFLDSDDAWPPWALERHAALIREKGPTWVAGRKPGDFDQALDEVPTATEHFRNYLEAAGDGLMPLPSGVVVSREALSRVGGFDERLPIAEDVDLWFRLGAEPGFVRIDSPTVWLREMHSQNLSQKLVPASLSVAELARRERRGLYPGEGAPRRAILAWELMGYAWRCRTAGRLALAARLYLLLWELQLRSRFAEPRFGDSRNRYLMTFPLQFLSPRLHDQMVRLIGRRHRVLAR